jgi:hypothetical protein
MTTTARIVATTSADTSYTFSVATGVTANFAADGLGPDEAVTIEVKDSSGGYFPFDYIDAGGHSRRAAITRSSTLVSVTGPIDARLNKSATASAVEVVEYT